jgi:hypothetical protein
VPLPLEPVLTRWGTWLNAAFYYNKHLEGFKKVVEMLGKDAVSITKVKSILQEPALGSQFFFLASHFTKIPETIETLQRSDFAVSTSVHEFKTVLHEAEKWPEKHGKKIKGKLYAVLERNCGWQSLLKLSAALEGEVTEFPNGWSREDALAAKYATATSVEVERTFSKLKYLLSDRRLTMTVKTLSSYLIVYNNYKNY